MTETSTSSDGKSHIPETLHLKDLGALHVDDRGIIYGITDDLGRLFLTFTIVEPGKINQVRDALAEIEANLRARGLNEYFSFVGSVASLRYAEAFGFQGTGEMRHINNLLLEVVRKGL